MHLSSLLSFGILFLLASAAPAECKPCKTLFKRKEWRSLSKNEQLNYINAVRCLQKKPASGRNRGAKTVFDDFQGLHIALTDEIHFVGQFLPWHRRMISVYEQALRDQCGYKGANPYWDWSIDVDKTGSILKSPVWDNKYGFGGNGEKVVAYGGQFGNASKISNWKAGEGGGCIKTGPFAKYILNLGPGTLRTPHCLERDLNDVMSDKLTSAQIRNTTRQKTFEDFRVELEGLPGPEITKVHDGGHFAVGGEMTNIYSSPGDPIFYLHHAQLDRIWWQWQKADRKKRLAEISGPTTVDSPSSKITLDFKLKMRGQAPDIPVRDIMDITSEPSCYDYV